MAEAKTLDYYLANPEEMPDDISQLANDMDPKEEAVEDVKETDEASGVEAEKVAEAEAPSKEEPKLLSKNGKEEIPYQVLVSERERRAQAERAAQELRDQLAAIEAKVAAGSQQQSQVQEPQQEPEIDIAQMSEDFPEIGKAMKFMQAQIEAANQKLQQVEQQEQARRAREGDVARNSVQEAIDANPTLRYWQNEDVEMFDRAVEFDLLLQRDPKNAHLSMEQRFDKLVTAMTVVYGAPELPEGYQSAEAPKTDDMKQLTEKAKEVVKETGSYKPRSLSDIPGGTPPAASEADKLTNMSPGQLAAMMQGMDQDQINSLLAKLG